MRMGPARELWSLCLESLRREDEVDFQCLESVRQVSPAWRRVVGHAPSPTRPLRSKAVAKLAIVGPLGTAQIDWLSMSTTLQLPW